MRLLPHDALHRAVPSPEAGLMVRHPNARVKQEAEQASYSDGRDKLGPGRGLPRLPSQASGRWRPGGVAAAAESPADVSRRMQGCRQPAREHPGPTQMTVHGPHRRQQIARAQSVTNAEQLLH